MTHNDNIPVDLDLARQLHDADSMSSTARRVGGLLTLIALGCWIWWLLWASNYTAKPLLLKKLSMQSSLMYGDSAAERGDLAIPEEDLAGMDLGTVKEFLAKKRAQEQVLEQARAEEVKEKKAHFEHMNDMQNLIMAVWIVVMIIVAAFMLGAGLAGLAGSPTARRWYRLVVYWTIIASACTVAGVYALKRWGGFPPPMGGYSLIAQVAAAQCSYALLIAIALLATRRTPAAGYAASR